MRRGAQGTVWALPLAFALSQGIGGNIEMALWSSGVFAALGFVEARWRRIILRAILYLGTLYLALKNRHGLLWLPEHTYAVLHAHHVAALASDQSMLLYVLFVPLLFLAFELYTRNVQWRLWQAFGGIVALAALQTLAVPVTGELALFAVLYFPVRYFDLGQGRAGTRLSAAGTGILFAAAALVLLALNPIIMPGVAYGHGATATEGYLANPQNIDVAVRRSNAREFFAAVAQPLYWIAFIGQRYTGQGWKVGGKWQTMQPLQQTGAVPSGERVLTERIKMYANLPTFPVAGNIITVLSPGTKWRYRAASGSYSVNAGNVTVLAAEPVGAGGITGPDAPPPTSSDLSVPAAEEAVALLAHQIILGVPSDPMSRAQAIIQYLDANERYTLNVPSDHGVDFVRYFLFTSHAGDCNAFSSAFALLARSVGIPTRWVSGFLPGKRVKGGYLVRAKDAHSWDEIYISGTGWVPIDPTPNFTVPEAAPPTTLQSASQSVQTAISSARLAQRNASLGHGGGSIPTTSRGIAGWAYPAALLALAGGVLLYVRSRMPLWWLRVVGRAFRDPWPRGKTVRAWLRGRAPDLQAYIEWRTYRPVPTCTVSLAAARRDLGRMYLRRGR